MLFAFCFITSISYQATAQQHLVSSLRDGKKNTRTRSAAEWSNVAANKKAYQVTDDTTFCFYIRKNKISQMHPTGCGTSLLGFPRAAWFGFLICDTTHYASSSHNSFTMPEMSATGIRYPSMRAAAEAVAKRRQKALLHQQYLTMRQKCLDVTFASANLLCSDKSALMLRRLDIQRRTRNSQRRKTRTRPFKLSMRKKSRSQRQRKKQIRSRPMSNFTLYSSYVGQPPTLAPASTSMPNDMLPKWQKPQALPASTTNDPLPKWQTNETKLPASTSHDALPQRPKPEALPQPTSTKFPEQARVTIDTDWQVDEPWSGPIQPGLLQLPDTFARLERPSHQTLFGSTPRSPSPRTAWRHEISSSLE